MWQDIVLGVANVLFTYSLVYQVYRGFKEKKGFIAVPTSFFTTIGLYAVSIVYLTYALYFSTIICAFNATMWLLLFIQRLIYKKA